MKIALFFSGNYIKRYEVEELTNLLGTKNEFIFFYHKKKESFDTVKNNIFFNLFFKHQFFSLVLLEQKFAEIICHKNSFNKKRKKLLENIKLENIIKNYDKYENIFVGYTCIQMIFFLIFDRFFRISEFYISLFLFYIKTIQTNIFNLFY